MNRFDRFTTEELKLLKEAIYIVINDNDNRFDCNEDELELAKYLFANILSSISRQKMQSLKHKSMSGAEIKEEIQKAGLKLWQVAYAYGVTDSHFSRLLRKDFTDEQTEKILSIINELKGEEK